MLIEKEILGANDQVANATDLLELRKSNRGLVPKRQWSEDGATEQPKPRKKRQRQRQLPTPNSTQNSTQFTIFEDQPIPTTKPTPTLAREPLERLKKGGQEEWEAKYTQLKKESTTAARDYLLNLVGNDEFPEAMKLPEVLPKVLIDEAFTISDPLSIWRKFITEKDLTYITKATNLNAVKLRR
jgi:hypothetical protein